METMTKPHSGRASRRRLAWPSWRAPMVGTRPTVRPAARAAATARRRSATVETTGITAGSSGAALTGPLEPAADGESEARQHRVAGERVVFAEGRERVRVGVDFDRSGVWVDLPDQGGAAGEILAPL